MTCFTRPGESARYVAEQWTTLWITCVQRGVACGPPVDNRERRGGDREFSTACGPAGSTYPQGADLRGIGYRGSAVDTVLDNRDGTQGVEGKYPQDLWRKAVTPPGIEQDPRDVPGVLWRPPVRGAVGAVAVSRS
ncbi:hypothetical protein GCM10009716_33090 [Streptomyces sodiiphilus]|uniref:Uncharacterized protein n=1 Tax=Streptomyces sodiiphilus TaxID=226217 RepID=A0ABP5AWF9_9ACTN